MIYLNFGSVCITQPRINAVLNISLRISKEIGYPIKIKQINTYNGYIQYQTKADKHIVKSQLYQIKIITDGILYEELSANILLKETANQSFEQLNNFEVEKKSAILLKNLYNTIIIDESHEHNKNMDLIITLINISLKLNITVKLIIMSATLDYDEKIFRRFFKYIDDDFTLPFYH